MNFTEMMTNPFILMFLSIFFGQLIGKIEFKNIKLGSSGGLFVGILISYFITKYLALNTDDSLVSGQTLIPKDLFNLSLIGFIASVGLLASKNIRETIKNSGFKFLVLGLVITFTGAVSTWIFSSVLLAKHQASIIGTYVGALTSSPGLATAIEAARNLEGNGEAMVGLGYSISYMSGTIIVIVFVQLLGKYCKREGIKKQPYYAKGRKGIEESDFSVAAFCIVCLIGVMVGKINVNFGKYIGNFSLGSTGGVLISALIFGDIGKIKSLNFNMNKKNLSAIRDISLNMFISTVGLNYGYDALYLVRTSGIQLLGIGVFTGMISITAGYLVGMKILRLNPIYLIGGICGGMTSTPGLAAAIESTNTDEVTISYGATYPFALFFMILFTSILFKI